MSFTPGKDSHSPGINGYIQEAYWTQARATALVKAGEGFTKTHPPRTRPLPTLLSSLKSFLKGQ